MKLISTQHVRMFFYQVVVLLTGLLIAVGAAQATTIGTNIVLSPTLSGSSSAQSVEADATLSSFTGGYGAAVMGNTGGTVDAGNSIVAGLIGKYTVTSNPSDHPAAGVVGEVGEGSAGSDAAIIAVLGGDSGELDSGAAYAVRYLNSTAGSQFTYGLDLFSAAIDSYQAVTYATADIRLQNGETISNSTDGVTNLGTTNVRGTSYNFGSATAVAGTGDAITIDFTPDLPALAAGLEVKFVAEAANTGATTLAIDGGAATAVRESADNTALEANDIRSGTVQHLVHDGTLWQQISQSGN